MDASQEQRVPHGMTAFSMDCARLSCGCTGDFEKAVPMKRHVRVIVWIGLCMSMILAAPAPSRAATSPFVGHWHWNKAKSTLPPSETLPSDMVADITRVDPLHVRWRVSITDSAGQQSVEAFDTPGNGEFYPVNADTMVAVRLSRSTLRATFRGPQGQIDDVSCTVSTDRQTMTCNGRMTRAGGQTQSYVDVYDRR